jgi:anthranilate phosphoribosyltransferase
VRERLESLLSGHDLTAEEADSLMTELTSNENEPALVGALLAALRAKGETPEEVRGFASGMRRLAIHPDLDASSACDVVGTGGDGSGSLNLSTGSALVAAAAGVPVVKHGNRSMSSQSGSADILEVLGLPMPLDEKEAARLFDLTGFTFLYAPYFHPAIGAVVPIRKALGVRTVFNMLGPLTNPGDPGYAVIGAWSIDAARLMAHSLAGTDIRRAFVCHGLNGWDEPTPVGPFQLFEVASGSVREAVLDPADYGFDRCDPDDLLGGTPAHNATALRDVLAGRPGPHREAVVLGAALAIQVTGRGDGLEDSAALARDAIDTGAAGDLVARLAGAAARE